MEEEGTGAGGAVGTGAGGVAVGNGPGARSRTVVVRTYSCIAAVALQGPGSCVDAKASKHPTRGGGGVSVKLVRTEGCQVLLARTVPGNKLLGSWPDPSEM